MAKIRHVFPGGNTCQGFYSFYDYMVSPQVQRKFVLKGGPGVGKSTFMKKMGEDFYKQGFDIEYHWCSSDNNSLDGVVIGNHQFCFLDGTAPHIVDPKFPGAVDEIINLGQFWDLDKIACHRDQIEKLSQNIARCFSRAYMRLKEASIAYEEWKSYFEEGVDTGAVKRNIRALTEDFLSNTSEKKGKTRHLFPGAITPEGMVTKINSLLSEDTAIFAVKGNPGSGVDKLFAYTLNIIEIQDIEAEIYHNPFYPAEIDLILLPISNRALLNISGYIFAYAPLIPGSKYKRLLDFDQFVSKSLIDSYAQLIHRAQERVEAGIKEAVYFINTAKKYHDELESFYIPSMDFAAIEELRQNILEKLINTLEK
ncbi:hypothetical protein SAMN02745221_02108 [Thermosyntropha lipolytica DSM 11003]|uniref:ATPase n=1 Tax=Thermosyntropha lipolytica DSM 11003 TaxID=1123382 RepID=A0A1M5RTW9_9FIRM|nr:PRK06851 family protein [Thermosyntropha lipolytica]SHH29757.1 hypothetical protein SAMN02745221_02108 [Thermosyntropha lipolytica DSM 11003]